MDVVSLLRGLLGLTVILGLASLASSNKKNISWHMVGSALGLQVVLAIFLLKGVEMGEWFAPLGLQMTTAIFRNFGASPSL